MRHNWNYKTIGDVCTSVTDGSHNPPKGIDKSDYRMISSQNIFDDNLILTDDSVRYLSKENHIIEDKRTRLQKDVVLLTIVGTIGRACILTGNEGPLTLQRSVAALHPSEEILPRFLLHTLIGNRTTLNQEAHGIAQKGLYLKQLSALRIPVPTIEEQQKIVSELDKINELIRLKKEQLKDYDNLAQSIFYEMFGDPVVNEKGWDNSTIESVCSSIVRGPFGSALKKEFFVESTNDTYKVYEQKHAIQKNHIIGSYYITKEKFQELRRFEVFPGDIIMSCSGTIGEFYQIPKEAEKGVMNQALLKFTLNENRTTTEFFMFLMDFIKNSFETKGTGLQNIGSVKVIKSMILGLPPLPLQQLFAQRIELIEQQKAEIKSTIADLETLLASRMQYWFDS